MLQAGSWQSSFPILPQSRCIHKHSQLRVTCSAKKQRGQAYYEKYKANRARHEGVLLPPQESGPAVPRIDIQTLQQYINRELWAYTFGLPSPHEPSTPPPIQSRQASIAAQDNLNETADSTNPKIKPGIFIPGPVSSPDLKQGTQLPRLQGVHPSTSQVYLFWDVASKHPGSNDPRIIAQRLKQLAAAYGQPVGLYAYSVRKDWNWVPEYFMKYRDPDLNAPKERSTRSVVVCPLCGVTRQSQAELQAHMQSVHALSPGQAASAVSSLKQSSVNASDGNLGNTAANGDGSIRQNSATRNTSRRTLGRIAGYTIADGSVKVPPAGHQLSLKYVLSQEGFEARIVQNSAESESVAVASGMGRLLDRVRRQELPELQSCNKLVVILVAEDEERLQQPLVRLRGIGGAATLIVRSDENRSSSSKPSFKGADAEVAWESICY